MAKPTPKPRKIVTVKAWARCVDHYISVSASGYLSIYKTHAEAECFKWPNERIVRVEVKEVQR